MAQMILTAEARKQCHLEVYYKVVTAELANAEDDEDGQIGAVIIKSWYIKDDEEWARITIPISEITSIQDTVAILKGFVDAKRFCIIDTANMPPLLIQNTYEEIRALVYGTSTVPIINIYGN